MDWLSASLISTVLVAICVLIHYESLRALNRLMRRLTHHRTSLLVTMYGLLVAHVIEIWLFALGYIAVDRILEIGGILPAPESWWDYAYFSAMVYTTVGFGDLVPEGAFRMMTMAEGLTGLSLITWSASFAFLEMQRVWRD